MKIIIFLALSLKLKIRHIGNPVGSIKVELDARFKLTPKGAKRLYFTLLNFNNFQFRRRSLSISSSLIVTNVYIQNSPHKKNNHTREFYRLSLSKLNHRHFPDQSPSMHRRFRITGRRRRRRFGIVAGKVGQLPPPKPKSKCVNFIGENRHLLKLFYTRHSNLPWFNEVEQFYIQKIDKTNIVFIFC